MQVLSSFYNKLNALVSHVNKLARSGGKTDTSVAKGSEVVCKQAPHLIPRSRKKINYNYMPTVFCAKHAWISAVTPVVEELVQGGSGGGWGANMVKR